MRANLVCREERGKKRKRSGLKQLGGEKQNLRLKGSPKTLQTQCALAKNLNHVDKRGSRRVSVPERERRGSKRPAEGESWHLKAKKIKALVGLGKGRRGGEGPESVASGSDREGRGRASL